MLLPRFKHSLAILVFLAFFFTASEVALADETGYRFATTCQTNGSSCENMSNQDTLYNSWKATYYEEVIVSFEDFGVPDDVVLDDIQVKMRIRTPSTYPPYGGWTWYAYASVDGGNAFFSPPFDCMIHVSGPCRYNTLRNFNRLNFAPTITWLNNSRYFTVSGSNINSNNFKLKLWQSTGVKDTDIDVLLFNVRYHDPDKVPPTPFLDLPWDYEGKEMDFNEAANAINSYFDHEYPLLSKGRVLEEPEEAQDSLVLFRNSERNFTEQYSSHDGYDYGRSLAKVGFGDSVLAAASGLATYVNTCGSCGNTIHIDHDNGYQTRYYHLQKDGLITDDAEGDPIEVEAGQAIGRVGFSGNVRPRGENGAHIHFTVVEDKNRDGNFEDNLPDGVTDPFGWQSKEPDPWENYNFVYGKDEAGNDIQRTGNNSFYLWKKNIDGLSAELLSNGGVFSAGKYTLEFPQDTSREELMLEMQSSPAQKISDTLSSVGSTVKATAKNMVEAAVTVFPSPFYLQVDLSDVNLDGYKADTLSIYSSIDGESWIKEEFTLDLVNRKISAEINHLTYFALVAERLDPIPPTTQANLSGNEVVLTSQDNEGGVGVEYTAYQIGEGDWEEYKVPLTFTNNGDYEVGFYSEDKDGNIEEEKNFKFTIGQNNLSSNSDSSDNNQVAVASEARQDVVNVIPGTSAAQDESEEVKGIDTRSFETSSNESTNKEGEESNNWVVVGGVVTVLGVVALFVILKKRKLLRKRA